MRYGEGLLEEIRRRTDLVQLVGRRIKLVRSGRYMDERGRSMWNKIMELLRRRDELKAA